MELAVNTFSKGLQMDTNPMVLGNDTLTDCLNGTLITMNGNEVILLNDMGNRRVDNAFLPSGYLPVGIKEYGGIIYIAAYNPITNKSQIGSFPSPERKIDEHDDSGLGTSFDFEGGFVYEDDKFLISDTILLPLTKDISLHAGDKFAIFADLNSISNQLTNYNNVDPIDKTRALSPKNKKYTLSIGILNSLNEFVDITKTLCRWDSDKKIIEYDSEYSDIFKFNDGYFISNETLEGFKDTIADSTLINERKRIAANTYSYKLIGPLYLKIQLNHIENFNYDILGTYDPDKKEADLLLTAYITYNCPDGIIPEDKQNSNDLYITFNEGTTTEFRFFDFNIIEKYQTTNSSNQNYYQSENKNSGNSKCIYNPGTNTYNIKVWKRYKLENILDTIINYNINVLANSELSDVYLKGLSVNDTLDLSLLGSGTVKLTEWKFYNKLSDDDFESKLKLSLNAYPKIGEKFNNLSIEFVGVDNKTGIITIGDISVYNGRQIIEFTGSTGLKKNKLYKVSISYDIIDEKSLKFLRNESLDNQTVERWFLTTELFNDFFNDNSITDYCTINPEDNQKFADKLNVKLYLDDNIEITCSEPNDINYGNLISTSTDIECGILHNISVTLKGNPQIKIKNPELYPDFIRVNQSSNQLIGFDSKNENKDVLLYIINGNAITNDTVDEEFIKNIETLSHNSLNDLENMIQQRSLNAVSTRTLNLELSYYDKYIGNSGKAVKFKYIFDRVSGLADDVAEQKRAGLCMDTDEQDRSRDEHMLYFVSSKKDKYDFFASNSKFPRDSDNPEFNKFDVLEIIRGSHDHKVTFFENTSVDISNYFKNKIPENLIFAFCNYPVKSASRNDPYAYLSTKDKKGTLRGNDYARVWWRGSSGNWILFNGLFSIKSDGRSTTGSSYYGNFKGNSVTSGTNRTSGFGSGTPGTGSTRSSSELVEMLSLTQFGGIVQVAKNIGNTVINYISRDRNNVELDTTYDSSNMIISPSEGEELEILLKFKNFLTSSFTKDYVYNMYTDYQDDQNNLLGKNYYVAEDNYAYNYKYSIPIGFKLIYSYLSNNQMSLCNIDYEIGNLKFVSNLNSINLISDKEKTLLIKSDPKFALSVEKFYNNYKNESLAIDKVTGNVKDYYGNDLDINRIYSIQNGELIPENNRIFIIPSDPIKSKSGKNPLLFNENFAKLACPSMRYDSLCGSSDGTSFIDYSQVRLADKTICK